MKSMTLFRTLMILGVFIGLSRPTGAQMVGLPLLDTADTRDPGSLEATPGIALGENMNFLGARATITLMDELRGFIDLGRLDTRGKGDNLALQVGGLYSLPMTDFCDTAIRGALYYSNTDYLDLQGGNVMLMCSDETLLDGLYAYGGLGMDISQKKIYSSSHTEINPAMAAGLTYKITDNFWAFLEGNYVDGWYMATGVSIR
jgi:hypothetical protein